MATNKLVFHLDPAASPTKIPLLLELINYSEIPILKSTDLDALALEQSADNNRFEEARGLAEQTLSLINMTKAGLQLTSNARVILKKREAVQIDLLHYLFYTAWNAQKPELQARAWLYRTVCNYLWTKQEILLDGEAKKELTQELDNQIRIEFENVSGFMDEKLSVGRKSIQGALKWLGALQPSVLEKKESSKDISHFNLRAACSAELFLLALSRSYETAEAEVGLELLLTPQRRAEISQTCLLNSQYFDRMLDWVLPIYPQLVLPGTRTGAYGRFVKLQRLINLPDLV